MERVFDRFDHISSTTCFLSLHISIHVRGPEHVWGDTYTAQSGSAQLLNPALEQGRKLSSADLSSNSRTLHSMSLEYLFDPAISQSIQFQ